eukprot:TRINITY_DN2093_c0_g1_i1.p1 TRINITY_DN2093_c0_g1~~TRINITY_DN2093_c0_g1_i1.p1  ORF type:complete len:542 (+),score=122.29 TRINITY_DN2093_c0_g1_i1:11-1636(+)
MGLGKKRKSCILVVAILFIFFTIATGELDRAKKWKQYIQHEHEHEDYNSEQPQDEDKQVKHFDAIDVDTIDIHDYHSTGELDRMKKWKQYIQHEHEHEDYNSEQPQDEDKQVNEHFDAIDVDTIDIHDYHSTGELDRMKRYKQFIQQHEESENEKNQVNEYVDVLDFDWFLYIVVASVIAASVYWKFSLKNNEEIDIDEESAEESIEEVLDTIVAANEDDMCENEEKEIIAHVSAEFDEALHNEPHLETKAAIEIDTSTNYEVTELEDQIYVSQRIEDTAMVDYMQMQIRMHKVLIESLNNNNENKNRSNKLKEKKIEVMERTLKENIKIEDKKIKEMARRNKIQEKKDFENKIPAKLLYTIIIIIAVVSWFHVIQKSESNLLHLLCERFFSPWNIFSNKDTNLSLRFIFDTMYSNIVGVATSFGKVGLFILFVYILPGDVKLLLLPLPLLSVFWDSINRIMFYFFPVLFLLWTGRNYAIEKRSYGILLLMILFSALLAWGLGIRAGVSDPINPNNIPGLYDYFLTILSKMESYISNYYVS